MDGNGQDNGRGIQRLLGIMVLVGAYGRDYSNWKDCIQDWIDGKDFKIIGGPYCSERDIPAMRAQGIRLLEFTSLSGRVLASIYI